MNNQKIAEIQNIISRETQATQIGHLYDKMADARAKKIEQIKELRNFLFATDTRTTSVNNKTSWKNSTTRPKLTQIRDNIHANYMNALFPNDRWLKWEGASLEDNTKEKRRAIEAYMDNKLREGGFIQTVSDMLYDYIDTGNVFADTVFVRETYKDVNTGEDIPGFIGPKAVRISIHDHVFDLTASSYQASWKITRYIKTIGQLRKEIANLPEYASLNRGIIDKIGEVRRNLGGYKREELNKAAGFELDGFGSISDYYDSNYVELLEFEGDLYDKDTDTLQESRHIWIIDKSYTVFDEPLRTWTGRSTKVHQDWRKRSDNLYGMGPLDNLVGMQYRIDHLENLKADAMDLAVHPPTATTGDADEVDWTPGAHNYLGENGQIIELGKNLNGVIAAQNEISILEAEMEEMAGAPREAAGIRTPGEKTAFEVQRLENARGRIFQHKIEQFERGIIEPLLNNMLEQAKRNMDTDDVVRVMDDDLGVESFLKVTKEDITAKGKLRPVGSRHFAATAQMVQNINSIFNSGIAQVVAPHISGKNLSKAMNALLGLDRFEIFRDNAQVFESAETQKLANGATDDVQRNMLTEGQADAGEIA